MLPPAIGKIPGAEFAVTGGAASNADYAQHQHDKLPLVIGFVLALTFLIMAFTFRSIVIALMTILVNMMSAAAAFGVLVLTFQHRWAEKLLHFHSNGTVVSWIPLFLFVVLFGLSMDYHVFVVSRIREAAQRGMSTRDAVAHGIVRSAGVVTSAADRHGVGVRDLRLTEHDRVQGARSGPRRGDPHRRARRAGRPAALAHGDARAGELVAVAPVPAQPVDSARTAA